MNMNAKWLVPALLFLALSTAASAENNSTPGLDRREANQEKRIEQGEKSGQLTPREEKRLERGEARLERHEAAAKSDGTVTPAERKRLHKEANRMSKRIHRQKHDAQKADPAP